MKKPTFFFIICIICIGPELLSGQYGQEYLGWSGYKIIPDEEFFNISRWTANAASGNSCFITASDTSIDLHWNLAAGKEQWVQCYFTLNEPVSLTGVDVFGFDLHGSECVSGYPCHKEQVVEIKFEDGMRQASHARMGEDGILCVNRWINKLFSNTYDNFFITPNDFRWDSVRIVSFGVKSHPWVDNPKADSGVVSFRNFIVDTISSWPRAQRFDTLTEVNDTLDKIKEKAIEFILSRQQSTGLLTTWIEDGAAWLYGQGLALKALTLEGVWQSGEPVNDEANAAENLAHFLASHQEPEGHWPRAWNSYTGAVIVPYEDDGSIWMGDMPWMLIGLYSYFKKSGDCLVYGAVERGEAFLKSLIEPDGTFYTLNLLTGERIPVTSSEAYASAIGALVEMGEDELAEIMLSHIDAVTWDSDLQYWNEGQYSDRIVLFTNTWLSLLSYNRGYTAKSLDAVSLTGRMMYTSGPGEPFGMDGIGPVAVWYEGTLSYIAAGGPGSNILFSSIKPFINADGSVPHYNDDIGGTAGIWAENWHSLDGTSWLYFVTSKQSPFEPLGSENLNSCPVVDVETELPGNLLVVYPNPCSNFIKINTGYDPAETCSLEFYQVDGTKLFSRSYKRDQKNEITVDVNKLKCGIYYFQLRMGAKVISGKVVKE